MNDYKYILYIVIYIYIEYHKAISINDESVDFDEIVTQILLMTI